MEKETIYLDYAATCPKDEKIYVDTYKEYVKVYANIASTHSMGKNANTLFEDAKRKIVATLKENAQDEKTSNNLDPNHIIFPSSNQECLDIFLKVLLKDIQKKNLKEKYEKAKNGNNKKEKSDKKYKILLTKTEHNNIQKLVDYIISVCPFIEKEYIALDKNGKVDLEKFAKIDFSNVLCIFVMECNNEVGTIQPIEKISEIIDGYDTYLFVDMVQSLGKKKFLLPSNVSFACASFHKLGGPNNFSIMYSKYDKEKLEKDYDIVFSTMGLLDILIAQKVLANAYASLDHTKKIKEYFLKKLKENNIPYELNGKSLDQVSCIANIYFPFMPMQMLIPILDVRGIYVSSTSACKSGMQSKSYAVTQMYDEKRADNSIRFSFGKNTTKGQIDKVVGVLKQICNA